MVVRYRGWRGAILHTRTGRVILVVPVTVSIFFIMVGGEGSQLANALSVGGAALALAVALVSIWRRKRMPGAPLLIVSLLLMPGAVALDLARLSPLAAWVEFFAGYLAVLATWKVTRWYARRLW